MNETIFNCRVISGRAFQCLYSRTCIGIIFLTFVLVGKLFTICSAQVPALDPNKNYGPSVSRSLSYYGPGNEWVTVEQMDKIYGINCGVPEAIAQNDLDKGDYKGALAVLATVTLKCQRGVVFNPLKAQAEMGVDDYSDAAELYRTSIGAQHNNLVSQYGTDSPVVRPLGDPREWLRYAECLYRSGQNDYGVTIYNLVATWQNQSDSDLGGRLGPNSLPILGMGQYQMKPSVNTIAAIKNVFEGLRAEGHGDPFAAHYTAAVDLAPNLPITQYMMAEEAKTRNKFDQARPYYEEAIALAKANLDPKSQSLADSIQKESDGWDPVAIQAHYQTLQSAVPANPPQTNPVSSQ